KDLPIELLKPPLLVESPVVAVTDEHDRLPIDLVREQRRSTEEAVARARRMDEPRGVANRRHVLADQTDEAARRKRVIATQSLDPCREQRPADGGLVVDVQPRRVADHVEDQMTWGVGR